MCTINNIKLRGIFVESKKKCELKEIFPIITFLSIVVAFVIRGFWYIYEWGYYSALGINRIYIDVESMGSLYYVISYLGIAILIIASNFGVYYLWINRKSMLILLCFLEILLFFWVSFGISNIKFIETLREIIKYGLIRDFGKLLLEVFIYVLICNIYGLLGGIVVKYFKKKIFINTQRPKIRTTDGVIIILLFMIISLVIEGIFIYIEGYKAGKNKKDYRIIIEEVLGDEKNEEKDQYIFDFEDYKVKIYPILYEDNEKYIISYLYWDESEIHIMSERQKVISKESVETVYCKDIFNLMENEKEEKIKNSVYQGREKEDKVIFMEILMGIIIGIFLSIICFFIDKKWRKKKEKKVVEIHSATVLYYDLKYIEKCLKENEELININCYNNWRNDVAQSYFLEDEIIMYIYKIYSKVFKCIETNQQKNMDLYKQLKELFFVLSDEKYVYKPEYEKVLSNLQKIRNGD